MVWNVALVGAGMAMSFMNQKSQEKQNERARADAMASIKEQQKAFTAYDNAVLGYGSFTDVTNQITRSGLLGSQTIEQLDFLSRSADESQGIISSGFSDLAQGIDRSVDRQGQIIEAGVTGLQNEAQRGFNQQQQTAQTGLRGQENLSRRGLRDQQQNITAGRQDIISQSDAGQQAITGLASQASQTQRQDIQAGQTGQLNELDAIRVANEVTTNQGQQAGQLTGDLLGLNGPEAQANARQQVANSPAVRNQVERAVGAIENSALASGDVGGNALRAITDAVVQAEQGAEQQLLGNLGSQQQLGQGAQSRVDQAAAQRAGVRGQTAGQLADITGQQRDIDVLAQREATGQQIGAIDASTSRGLTASQQDLARRSGALQLATAQELQAQQNLTGSNLAALNQGTTQSLNTQRLAEASRLGLEQDRLSAELGLHSGTDATKLGILQQEQAQRLGNLEQLASLGISNLQGAQTGGIDFQDNIIENLQPVELPSSVTNNKTLAKFRGIRQNQPPDNLGTIGINPATGGFISPRGRR